MRLLLYLLGLLCVFSAHAAEPDRRITVTIDDLRWQRMATTSPGGLRTHHAALLEQQRCSGVPVVGFVNEDKLEIDSVMQSGRVATLEAWLDACHALVNRPYGHVDAHVVGISAFQDAILRGDCQLRPMLAKRGQTPRWFRHPHLSAGRTPEDNAIADRRSTRTPIQSRGIGISFCPSATRRRLAILAGLESTYH